MKMEDVKDMFFAFQKISESDKRAANNQCLLYSLYLKKMSFK